MKFPEYTNLNNVDLWSSVVEGVVESEKGNNRYGVTI
jgi:hypothetical protein